MKKAKATPKPISTRTLERRITDAAFEYGYCIHMLDRAVYATPAKRRYAEAADAKLAAIKRYVRELRRRAEGKEKGK